KGAKNMQLTTPMAPDLSQVSDLSSMFRDTEAFNHDLSSWDVSKIQDMSYMFYGTKAFDQDLSSWDVSMVKDMGFMFLGAKAFNSSLAGWKPGKDVANGCSLLAMFQN